LNAFDCLQMISGLGAIAKDAVFPTRCCGCGRLYHRQRPVKAPAEQLKGVDEEFPVTLDEYLCDRCVHLIEPIRSPFCTHCGRPFDSPEGVNHICGRCQEDPFHFSIARSAGVYSHGLKELICQYKYKFRAELAISLSRLLWQTLCQHWDPEQIDCIIPVPLHSRRMRERGFNQAELLIRQWPGLAWAQGIPFYKSKLAVRALIRCRYTPPQTGLDRNQRAANLRHAFELTDPAAVQGRRVLLVDDVLTTGATANTCARVLKGAKAVSVSVLTLARAA
jgi:ComF family protein